MKKIWVLGLFVFLGGASSAWADTWPPPACSPKDAMVICQFKLMRDSLSDALVASETQRLTEEETSVKTAEYWKSYVQGLNHKK